MNRALALLGAAVLVAIPAFAQQSQPQQEDLSNLSFEELMQIEVVFAASKVQQKTSEAPSSVTIVTADEIRAFGYRSLADILRSVRGFAVTNDRSYSYVGVRGFGRPGDYNTRLLLLIDGTPVNENVYGSVLAGEENLVDPALIERVEIVRGAASSIYGSNAFFGVINVITRNLSGVRAEVAAEASSRDTQRERATLVMGSADRVSFDVSATVYDSAGSRLYFAEYDTAETGNGVTTGTDDENAWRYLANLRAGNVRVQAAGMKREKGVPTGSFETTFDDPRNRSWDELHYLSLAWTRDFSRGRSLSARATAGRYNYEENYVYEAINRDEAVGEWLNGETVFTLRRATTTTIAGIEIQDDRRQVQKNFDIEPREVYLDVSDTGQRFGGFLQHEFPLHRRVRANVGFRYDHYKTFGGRLSPRGALIIQTSPSSTLKVLAGDAFRAPTMYERLYDQPPYQVSNPDLDPETIRSYEVAYERLVGAHSQLVVSLFSNTLSNLIEFQEIDDEGLLQFNNVGRVLSRGGEIELGTRWTRATLTSSYSYQKTTDDTTDLLLTNSPQHLVKSHLTFRIGRGTAGLQALYTSRRKTLDGGSTDPFAIANATLVIPLRRGFSIDASAYNMLDERVWDPGSEEHLQPAIEQDGRTFRVRLTWTGTR